MSSTFDLIIKHKIKTLEEETMLGLYNIISHMHKHAVEDYINVISCYYDVDPDEVKSEYEFNKIFRKNFFEMFVHIEEDFQHRVNRLKSELIKRFDIESEVEESSSESDSEFGSESDSESENDKENDTKPAIETPIKFNRKSKSI